MTTHSLPLEIESASIDALAQFPTASNAVIDLDTLQAVIDQAEAECHDVSSLAERLTPLLQSALGATAIVWTGHGPDSPGCLVAPQEVSDNFDEELRDVCLRSSVEATEAGQVTTRCLTHRLGELLIAVPISGMQHCFVGLFRSDASANQARLMMQFVASRIAIWLEGKEVASLRSRSQQTAAIVELVARVSSASHLQDACDTLAGELRKLFNADNVVIGTWSDENRKCTIRGTSTKAAPKNSSDLPRLTQAALDEAVIRGQLSIYPPVDSENRHSLLAHRTICEAFSAASIISLPLRDDQGDIIAVCAVVSQQPADRSTLATKFLGAAATPLASALRLLALSERGTIGRAIETALDFLQQRRGKVIAAILVICLLAMLIPLPYRVKCDCAVEPVVRRYVAAPFAGPLERTLVEPGEVVEAGQLLARMDGRDVKMELASTQAELHRAAKERAGHMAAHDFGKIKLSQHDVERLTSKTRMLEQRADSLEVRSPISGIVVSGDLEKAEGIPMDVGQTMFEIAPLEKLHVEVAIPEDDVNQVGLGMEVGVFLNAFPLRRFAATIERVHSRAEIKDHANVFVGVVSITNESGELRPGMKGRAVITTKPKLLGWSLFHRPVGALRRWVGW